MVRPRFSFEIGYEDIAEVCGVSRNAVSKAVARELLDMSDLMSIVTYCAAHATEENRLEIMTALCRMGDYKYRGANRKPSKKGSTAKTQ